MKTFLLSILIITALFANAFSQPGSDSLAYQQQRKKINAMLAQRTIKFGQYDESLGKHTGIFGLQTKKDIRRSNDILMDIVKTDNDIYRELKILLDYRMFQQKQVVSHTKETEVSTIGYMTTINKLRAGLDAVKAEAEKQDEQQEKNKNVLLLVILALSVLLLLILFIRKKKPAPPKRKPAARKSVRRT